MFAVFEIAVSCHGPGLRFYVQKLQTLLYKVLGVEIYTYQHTWSIELVNDYVNFVKTCKRYYCIITGIRAQSFQIGD